MPAKRTIALARPSVGDEEWQATREPLSTGWLTQGPQVMAFESEFARRHDCRFAVATTSGTTALHLALVALGVGEGDEVIIPAFTWVATANAVLQCGATPVLIDVDPVTFNMEAAAVQRARTPRSKAVIPVHLFGLCADTPAIRAAVPDLFIIEDAACAAGARLRGQSAGAQGSVGVFSFHPRKTITTGEGGMLTTNDEALAERAIALRNHGASASSMSGPHALPEFGVAGFNYRMTDVQAAIGRVQLAKLDGFIEERSRWASYYFEQLDTVPWLHLPSSPSEAAHAWQAYVCRVDPTHAPMERNDMMAKLAAAGIGTRPGTTAIHTLRYHSEHLRVNREQFPGATECFEQSMAIPLHNEMIADDYGYVVDQLRQLG